MALETLNPASKGGALDCQLGGDGSEHSRTTRVPQPIHAELRGCYTATAEGLTVDYENRRRGSPICALARKLIEAGHNPSAELCVFRDGTLAFNSLPLSRWAGLSVAEGDDSDRSAHFMRYRPPPSRRARSGMCSAGFIGGTVVSRPKTPEDAA